MIWKTSEGIATIGADDRSETNSGSEAWTCHYWTGLLAVYCYGDRIEYVLLIGLGQGWGCTENQWNRSMWCKQADGRLITRPQFMLNDNPYNIIYITGHWSKCQNTTNQKKNSHPASDSQIKQTAPPKQIKQQSSKSNDPWISQSTNQFLGFRSSWNTPGKWRPPSIQDPPTAPHWYKSLSGLQGILTTTTKFLQPILQPILESPCFPWAELA